MSAELLGFVVKDKITGYTGVAVAYSEYMYAGPRISVASIKEGTITAEAQKTFDVHGIVKVSEESESYRPRIEPIPVVFKSSLGDLVEDLLTGLKGIVIARTTWLYGCKRVGVQQQKIRKGYPLEGCMFEDERVIVKKASVFKVPAIFATNVAAASGDDRGESAPAGVRPPGGPGDEPSMGASYL